MYKIKISEPLRHLEFVKDELRISNSGVVTVIRRLGTTGGINGEVYVLEEEITETLEAITIISPEETKKSTTAILHTFEKDTYIYVKEFYNLDYEVKYITQSDYSEQFITKVDFESSLKITSQEILSTVKANYVSETELNSLEKSFESSISQTSSSILSTVSANYATKTALSSTETNLKSQISQTAESITSTVSSTYATKTALSNTQTSLESKISQTSSSILATVSGTYATKSSVSASLELKLNTKDLVSEINASADRISLKAGRLVITSGNFKLDTNGSVTCVNGNFEGTVTSSNATITGGSLTLYTRGTNVLRVMDSTLRNNKYMSYITEKVVGINNGNYHVECTAESSFAGIDVYGPGTGTHIKHTGITTPSLTQTSLEDIKKNITKFEDALGIIKNSEIYSYNLKVEQNKDKKHTGFIIGEKYNTPAEVIAKGGEGIDTYSMSSIEWRALQQCIELIENLQERVKVLEVDNT